jgi:hypothetical protein
VQQADVEGQPRITPPPGQPGTPAPPQAGAHQRGTPMFIGIGTIVVIVIIVLVVMMLRRR